ncbi:hypothetical protein J3E69DRAFT_334035 [Trichoderma sp. SZMC 28015]
MVLTLTWPRFGVRFDDLSDLVLCRSSTIPLFQNQILNRPSSTGQKCIRVPTDKRGGNKTSFLAISMQRHLRPRIRGCSSFGHEGNSDQAHPVFPSLI